MCRGQFSSAGSRGHRATSPRHDVNTLPLSHLPLLSLTPPHNDGQPTRSDSITVDTFLRLCSPGLKPAAERWPSLSQQTTIKASTNWGFYFRVTSEKCPVDHIWGQRGSDTETEQLELCSVCWSVPTATRDTASLNEERQEEKNTKGKDLFRTDGIKVVPLRLQIDTLRRSGFNKSSEMNWFWRSDGNADEDVGEEFSSP